MIITSHVRPLDLRMTAGAEGTGCRAETAKGWKLQGQRSVPALTLANKEKLHEDNDGEV